MDLEIQRIHRIPRQKRFYFWNRATNPHLFALVDI